MKTRSKLIGLSAAALALGIGTYAFTARSEEASGFGPPFMRQGMGGGMMGSGMMAMAHDAATMAQLRVIHLLFVNHDRIKRTVTNLPDGICTVTEWTIPRSRSCSRVYVADMMKRVDAGDDPGLPIQSDALHAIFRDKDKVHTSVEATAKGAIVIQTSDDPKTVAALQEHAAQVTDFAEQGMAALHMAMMKNVGEPMHGRMMGPGMMSGMHGMMGGGMMRGPM